MRIKTIRPAALAASLALAFSLSAGLSSPAVAQSADVAALTERLFTAVRANDIATVRLVLTNGADPLAVDANGQTPAGIAIDRGYFEVAHHILGVRNQRQALTRREGDDLNPRTAVRPASALPSTASAPGQERKPDVTWRETTTPGQAAEIPTPRLASPQEATVLTPAMVITGPTRTPAPAPAAQKKAAEKGPVSGPVVAAPAPAPVQQATLANLPALPAGAPNPFDPKSAEPDALPVLSSTAPSVRPELTSADGKSRETSPSNPISRFFNGITGVFGGGGS